MGYVLGIDPGLSGALVWFDGEDMLIHDMPTLVVQKNKRQIDEFALARQFDAMSEVTDHVILEHVSAMPKQGVTSSFNFGQSFGVVRGVVAAYFLPVTLVRPKQWKKDMQVPAAKDGAKQRANQLMPRFAERWPLVKHDGRAEAAMLALYGIQQGKQKS